MVQQYIYPHSLQTTSNYTNPNIHGNDYNQQQQIMEYLLQSSNATTQIGLNSSAQTAYYSYLSALSSTSANIEQNRISTLSERANSLLDSQQLSLRTNYGTMVKQVESSLLSSQVREKLFNLFNDMERSKLDNTFQRAKSIVQGFKY